MLQLAPELRSRITVFNQQLIEGAPQVKVDVEPQKSYQVPESDFKCYGGARELWKEVEAGCPQVMIHGPAETGKTIAALHLVNHLAWKYPNCQGAITRKIGADLWSTVISDFDKKVLKLDDSKTERVNEWGVRAYGGQKPEFYQYPNGSRIWVGGLDHPGKVLSAQRDFVYTNQTEEFEQDDWETISTRTTGRGGVLQPGRLIGDCNPGPSTHWIISLAQAGTLKMIKSNHKDNPTLFNPETGEITEQGKRSIEALKQLTGVRLKRLYQGLWVAAEGVVYEDFDPTIHVREKPLADIIYYVVGVDWGYTNPGVFQLWGVDGDGRMYRVMEIYQTQKLVTASNPADAWWINRAKALLVAFPEIRTFVADPSRPDHIDAFSAAGIPIVPAFNDIELGIQNVQSRLKVQADGWPRIVLLKGSRGQKDERLVEKHLPTCLEEEIEVYAFPKETKRLSTANQDRNENPVPQNNHAADALRYSCALVDGLGENEFLFG